MLPWKLFPAFAWSRTGSAWPPRVEQEGGDGVDGRAVEHLAVGVTALGDMQHAHDDRRLAGPLDPLGGAVDLAAVLADPAKSARAGVALGDGVRGDEAKCAAVPESG